MNKKQIHAFLQSLVLRVQNKANTGCEEGEPALEEGECRTLLGIYLRQNAEDIVTAIVFPDGEPQAPAPVAAPVADDSDDS